MQEYKLCPTCNTKNAPSNLSCHECERDLWDTSIQREASLNNNTILQSKVPVAPPRQSYKKWAAIFVIPLVALLVIFSSISIITNLPSKKFSSHKPQGTHSTSSPLSSATPSLPQTLGTIAWQGQNIGVNDGSFAPFDIGRKPQEMAFKQQAATALKQGNAQAAIALWYQALGIESNDAEVCIYIEDQRVLTSKISYVTLIAGTSFTPPFPDAQYEGELQGIYVAQHAFNQEHQDLQLRVLIANLGNSVDTGNTLPVVRQITQVATQDATVVGIIGWLNSSSTLNALSALGKFKGVNIPIISPQASSDHLSGVSPYFFRVVGPNKGQAQAAAQFMKNILQVKTPVVFVDPHDQYSQNLAQDFEARFSQNGHLPEVDFKTDGGSNFSTLITQAEQYHPDAFYFTSASSVDAGHFEDALPTTGTYATTPAMAGDGGYAIHPNSYGRWYFTEYAYHGESNQPIAEQFAQDYTADFDPGPNPPKPDGTYGYSLPDDHAILAYDATSVVLTALEMADPNGNTTLTSQVLADTLPKIKDANTFQGVSGQIAFGPSNDPVNKAIVILYASKDGHTTLYTIQGCFVKGCA